ncbi:MAG: isoprenylcysteine carboxylmethyltransferase family protein [Candidatus Omnitrophica bacterium]|nr:isoprenylcysteine carboxylmethyltransferase family protein [Candidatus Omnitrophota bacterium]
MKMLQIIKKTRFAVMYPFVVFMFLEAKTTDTSLALGMIVVCLGELIRWWANGFVGHNKVNRTSAEDNQPKIGRLITAGPYRYVRHPLYLGTFLIVAGICVTASNIYFATVVLAVYLMVYQHKINQEDELLSDECSSEHADYKNAVPQWIPFKVPYSNPNGFWTWEGIKASKEWKTAIWLGVLFIVLYLRGEWYQEGEFFEYEMKPLLFLGLIVLLVSADLFMIFRKKRNLRPLTP